MLKLSKKVEYGILSLQYLALKENQLVRAKEIAEDLNISFEFLSKTLQTLMKKGLINSQQGIKGGYFLAKDAREITLSDIVSSLESNPQLIECIHTHEDGKECERLESCTIRNPLMIIQSKIDQIFKETTLEDLKAKEELVSLTFENN